MNNNIITTDHIEELLERLSIKVRMFDQYREAYKDNIRECPFYSEKVGIEETMKVLGIEFEYEFDDDINVIAVRSGNIRVEI